MILKCDTITITRIISDDNRQRISFIAALFLSSEKMRTKHRRRVLFQSDVILVKLWILGNISCSNNSEVSGRRTCLAHVVAGLDLQSYVFLVRMGKKEDVQIVKFGVEIFIFEADLTSHTLRPSDSTPGLTYLCWGYKKMTKYLHWTLNGLNV